MKMLPIFLACFLLCPKFVSALSVEPQLGKMPTCQTVPIEINITAIEIENGAWTEFHLLAPSSPQGVPPKNYTTFDTIGFPVSAQPLSWLTNSSMIHIVANDVLALPLPASEGGGLKITLSKRIYTSEYYVPAAEYTLVFLLYSRDTRPYAEPQPQYDLLTSANSTRTVFLDCGNELYVDPDEQAARERERALKIALPLVIVPIFVLVFGTTLGQWIFWRRWRVFALLLWPAIWLAKRGNGRKGGEPDRLNETKKGKEEELPSTYFQRTYESRKHKMSAEDDAAEKLQDKSQKQDKAPLPPTYVESELPVNELRQADQGSSGGGGLLAMLADPELAQRLEERDEEEQLQHRQRSSERRGLSNKLVERGPVLMQRLRGKDQASLRRLSESRLRRWFWWRIDKFPGTGKRDWEGWRRRLGRKEKWSV